MKLKLSILMIVVCAVAIGLQEPSIQAATEILADDVAQAVVVRDLKVEGAVVSGRLVNRSSHDVRDVQLSIRHIWQWKDEFHPKEDDLSTTVFYTVEREIAPGGSVPFTYQPSEPLPSRPDGYFETQVSVAGFTEVIR